jgi:hypothetical protein
MSEELKNALRVYMETPNQDNKNILDNLLTQPQIKDFYPDYVVGLDLYKKKEVGYIYYLKKAAARINLDTNFILNILDPIRFNLINPSKRTRSRKNRSKRNRKTRKARK